MTNGNEVHFMKDEYDFSHAQKNPYANNIRKPRQQITINIDSNVIEYFKEMAAASGVPYQTLINLYLADCVRNHRTLTVSWE